MPGSGSKRKEDMIEPNEIIMMLLYGALIGTFYFVGLSITLDIAKSSRKAPLLFLLSFILRASIAIFLIFIFSSGNGLNILILLAGFLTARFLTVRIIKNRKFPAKEEGR